MNDLVEQLSHRGVQYGIYPDGAVRIFVGGRLIAVTEDNLEDVIAAYQAAVSKLESGQAEKIQADIAAQTVKRKRRLEAGGVHVKGSTFYK